MSRRAAFSLDLHIDDDATVADIKVESMRHVDGSVSVGVHIVDVDADADDVADQITVFGQLPVLRHIHAGLGRELDRLDAGGD